MNGYHLIFDGTAFGDEVVQTLGTWQKTVNPTSAGDPPTAILAVDDIPLAVAIYPRFRVRKTAIDQWAFERWVFDLLARADGLRRALTVVDAEGSTIVNYGLCKFLALERPVATGPHAGRGSDQIVLMFQGDTPPVFS